jgi:SAM-dependent methyltransferase
VTGSPPHVRKNRRDWDTGADEYQAEHAKQLNRFGRPVWGVWGIPESTLQVLGDVRGKDVLEYGCGAGQWSICLSRLGAHPVGVDLSIAQLGHARRLMAKAKAAFPLVNANAERAPFADASFDIVMCDHGAMTFADPSFTVPEVSRLLRPGGLFAFNIASAFHEACWDDEKDGVGERLYHDYFGMRRFEESDSVSFALPYGEWIRLFRANGLEVEDLIEPRPSARARTTYEDYAPHAWARRFPSENIWKVRKRG